MSDATADAKPIAWRSSWMKLQGQLVRQRGALGLTQPQLAERLPVSLATIKRWENGHATPSALDLFRWAAELGIAITSRVESVTPDAGARP